MVVPLPRSLCAHPTLLEEVVLDLHSLNLGVLLEEEDLDEFPEARRIVITHRACIAEGLQDGVAGEHLLLHRRLDCTPHH